MQQADNNYGCLIYAKQEKKFPMISSVLEGIQQGIVLKNNKDEPTHFFVINKFGWCQEFYSEFDAKFFEEIKRFIFNTKHKKLRCYAPSSDLKDFLETKLLAKKSSRVQFLYSGTPGSFVLPDKFSFKKADKSNILAVDFGLDLADRYWSSADDFVSNAGAILVFDQDNPIAICYSAANGMSRAEIDIFVDQNYRKNDIGLFVGFEFLKSSLKKGLTPNWDCYENNNASMVLASKLGFIKDLIYEFYNVDINRDSA